MNLDEELKAAFRREDPSPGFAQRVVARTRSKPTRWAMPRLIWASAIAAMLMIGFTAMYEVRQRKAERAGHEAVLALQIAAEKLNMTRDKIGRREN
jgi:hypothetical protein